MSGTTSTWVGGNGNDWNTAANWTNGVPNGSADVAIVNVGDGIIDAIISGGSTVTLASLSIGDPATPAPGLVGGHVIVGGSPDIGGGGGGALTSTGTITVTSTNLGGGLVGGLLTTITAPAMIVGTGAVIGGGGTFNIDTIINNGMIQADGGFFGLGTLVLNAATISGTGFIEVDGPSGLELNAATSQKIIVDVAASETATIVFDQPAAFTGSLELRSTDTHVNLFFKGQTPTGATFDDVNSTLVITDASGTIAVIPFTSNGVVSFSAPSSTLAGFGEITIVPTAGADTIALPPANLVLVGATTPGGSITNDALPTITGTGETGAVVTLRSGTTVLGTGTVAGGVWSITLSTPLVAGANAITATQTDLAGNVSAASAVLTVTFSGGTPNPIAPVVTAGAIAAYDAGGAPVALDPALTVTDQDSVNLASATVAITSGFLAGDTLSATPAAGITASYNAATGVLTLTGTASVSAYQAALDSVTFRSTSVDPTAGSTATSRTLTWSVNDGAATGVATSTVTVTGPGGVSDVDVGFLILLQQDAGGVLALQRTGASTAQNNPIGNSGPSWHVKGIGDFDGDGNSDLLYQNDDGTVATWNLNGTSVVGAGVIGSNPGTTWHVIGTNDFNRDGRSDILFQNDDGSVAVWNVDGTAAIGASLIGSSPGTSWHVKGTGDFSGAGGTDILFQNDDGSVAVWNVDGTAVTGAALVGANPGTTWHIKGTGDFNGDGATDILFQNDDGSVAVWNMDGTSITGATLVGSNPGTTWHVKGASDLNGDGVTDILFQNDNGAVAVWDLDGTSIIAASLIGSNSGPTWHVVGSDRMNFIDGTTGTAPLAATSQADTFNLSTFDVGAHVISGFNASQDVIEFSKSLFANFDALQASSSTVGDTVISLVGGSTLTVQGIPSGTLQSNDFLFV